MRRRAASPRGIMFRQALAIQATSPNRIHRMLPHQGTGDSCLGSGECSTLSPHFGHSFTEAGKRISQPGQ